MRAREESKDGNLISILSTMAEVGLYDDVNDKLKFVSNSELPRALLWIGKAQGISRSEGGRGDREAANITLTEQFNSNWRVLIQQPPILICLRLSEGKPRSG